jgi:hypothetical protein
MKTGKPQTRLRWHEIECNAIAFSKRWKKTEGREEAQGGAFTTEFLRVFGVDDPVMSGAFEYWVHLPEGKKGKIDCLWKKRIAIEMKSKRERLESAYSQLRNYMQHLPPDDIPDLWMACNFTSVRLTRQSTKQRWDFKIAELSRNIHLFADIAGYETPERVRDRQPGVNARAAGKMARLHDALKARGYGGRDLEVYLVRLLFCLFAEDTGIFPKDSLLGYIKGSSPDGTDLADRIARLFEVLNLPDSERSGRTHLPGELRQFRYVNGGLFSDRLAPADFDARTRSFLLDCTDLDWSAISPAIFGAMFQGVMDPRRRRVTGAHYTSEENIMRLINPLFLDGLWDEFEHIKTDPGALPVFHDKISRLKFLDPACGCGNFLIIAYRELRLLEHEIIELYTRSHPKPIDLSLRLKVNVNQFHGVELAEFPSQIARTGMWLMEHLMNILASDRFGACYASLPMTGGATIVCGNALRMDWGCIVPAGEADYILGNPPFGGARIMTPGQKSDMSHVFGTLKGVGNLDYVTAWYKKASDFSSGTGIRCAFVSTNSIAQGEQPGLLWKLLEGEGARINFAIPEFRWSNEARGQAAVYCVIIGFSHVETRPHINQYLIEAPSVFIESSKRPICAVPSLGIGNKPIDGGKFLFTEEEMREFVAREPASSRYFRKWIGSEEFINGYFRHCLLLRDCPPDELRGMPECMRRIEAVRAFRLASGSDSTRRIAEAPLRFHVENFPATEYLAVPRISSENRRYIPMGFVQPDILASDAMILSQDATHYHFGVLTSCVHMAWVRATSGRLKRDYRYSVKIVYNNFPWPEAAPEQQSHVACLTRAVIAARKLFPQSSLDDLYDPLAMPDPLRKAHRELDRAVARLYGFTSQDAKDEARCVARLLELHERIVRDKSPG